MGVACATPLFLYIFVFQRINGIFFFNIVHCIDHGCKHHKKSAECSKQKKCRHSTFPYITAALTSNPYIERIAPQHSFASKRIL